MAINISHTMRRRIISVKNNASVIIYRHWWIPPEKSKNYSGYIEGLNRIKKHLLESKRTKVKLLCVKAAHRDFFFVLQTNHYERISQAIYAMLDTGWSKYLAFRKEIGEYVFD